ncbi:SMC family ATPase [Candidatus Woesearchaeota archaeon]|nr:SMC family ATPase [Candidatus Woesearchaeota archaeon]
MLLRQLRLENIRSYQQETVTFPEGTLLLSGDIGSGKSSLLLAIEFALFGASRPDLPAESLLRKGSTQGSVELTFSLDGQDILIQRNLKKTKLGIQQTAGFVLKNNAKKELTPVELKAEVLSLLGYPEEMITKNKNYLFRYTVYTPQEEMKFILQEAAESRLDVLRKIFGIDKYKVIRENVQLYTRILRTRTAVLEAKIAPLQEQQEQLQRLIGEKAAAQGQLEALQKERSQLGDALQQKRAALHGLEKAQQAFREMRQQHQIKQMLCEEKQRQKHKLTLQEKGLREQLQALGSLSGEKEQLLQELQNAEAERELLLKKKATQEEQLRHVQKLLAACQKEVQFGEELLVLIPKKQEFLQELRKKVQALAGSEEKDLQLLELLEKTNVLFTRNQTLLQQAQELRERIEQLDTCPTCLQQVSSFHKMRITAEKAQEIARAEKLLADLTDKKTQMQQHRQELQEQRKAYYEQKNMVTRLELELAHLEEKNVSLEKKRAELQQLLEENNALLAEEQQGETERLQALGETIAQRKKQLEQVTKKEHLEKQEKAIKDQEHSLQQEMAALQSVLQAIERELQGKEDFGKQITEQQQLLSELQEQEKIALAREERQRTLHEQLCREEIRLRESVAALSAENQKLLRLKEREQWLEGHFVPLTGTIEKHVMVRIHRLFNQLFQEWFSLLIDDAGVLSRLDEEFTPIVEQNGHELFFENLSGGEKTSAALAYRLALNRVINDVVHEIKTKDLLILDEPTDGFSSEQLDKVRDVLERLALRQVILVSHEAKVESFVNHVIRVQKGGEGSGVVG